MLPAFEISKLFTPKRGLAYFSAQKDASVIQKMTPQLLKNYNFQSKITWECRLRIEFGFAHGKLMNSVQK